MMTFTLYKTDDGILVDRPAMQFNTKLVNYFTVSQEDIVAFYVLSKIYYLQDDAKIKIMGVQPAVYNYIRNNTQKILDHYIIYPTKDNKISAKIKACRKYFTDIEIQKTTDMIDYMRSCLYKKKEDTNEQT